jgi:hypothetical protein
VLEARRGQLIEAIEQPTVEGLERVGVDLAVDRQDDRHVHRHREHVELQRERGALAVLGDDDVAAVVAEPGRRGADQHGRQRVGLMRGEGGGRGERGEQGGPGGCGAAHPASLSESPRAQRAASALQPACSGSAGPRSWEVAASIGAPILGCGHSSRLDAS